MAGFVISQQWLSALDAYAEGLQATTETAAIRASEFLHERVVDKARADPDWVHLADSIETWSQDGQLVIGVRENERVSEAFALEYGTEVRPPIPLFRTMSAEVRQAGEIIHDTFQATYGAGV